MRLGYPISILLGAGELATLYAAYVTRSNEDGAVVDFNRCAQSSFITLLKKI